MIDYKEFRNKSKTPLTVKGALWTRTLKTSSDNLSDMRILSEEFHKFLGSNILHDDFFPSQFFGFAYPTFQHRHWAGDTRDNARPRVGDRSPFSLESPSFL